MANNDSAAKINEANPVSEKPNVGTPALTSSPGPQTKVGLFLSSYRKLDSMLYATAQRQIQLAENNRRDMQNFSQRDITTGQEIKRTLVKYTAVPDIFL